MRVPLSRFSAVVALGCGVVVVALIVITQVGSSSAASSSPDLGSAANFSVLAGSTVTSVPASSMNLELGLSPGSSVTGAPVASQTHVDDAVAVQAKTDLTAAYLQAAAEPSDTTIPDAGDIGGETLTPGVYTSASSIFLTGNVTLNGPGVYVFQAGSTVITAANSSVTLENGADPCDVFWQVGSSGTLGTGSKFVGTMMALTSIADDGGSTVDGRLLAQNGAVTLNMTTIITAGCGPVSTATSTATATTSTTVSPPTTTTIDTTTTGPCGCHKPPVPPVTKPKPPVTVPPTTIPPGVPVTVRLPAPGCGCVVVRKGTVPAKHVVYRITHIVGHCHASVNQKAGTLTVKATRPGKIMITLHRGKQKITEVMHCDKGAKVSGRAVVKPSKKKKK